MTDLKVYNFFRDRELPEKAVSLAGYAALIDAYDLQIPLPEKLSFISQKQQRYETDQWAAFTPRHQPSHSLSGYLTFALKYEGVDLSVLNSLFIKINPQQLSIWIRSEPLGIYSRRIWFFYEWLTGNILDVPDTTSGNFVEAIDPKSQYATSNSVSYRRQRVYNNLPGVRGFCPLIRRTEKLEKLISLDLAGLASKQAGAIHSDLLTRASAFMLLNDSRASFAIEGERPGKDRTERWGRAISQAGRYQLTIEELLRLQSIVIADERFVKLGLRQEEGFVGEHDRFNRTPIPDHISARWKDLPSLMESLLETYAYAKEQGFDPILLAACLAFGFVFIHPFADGNGRIHRYIIHHVLDTLGFSPKGIVFPVSAVILERLDEYRQVLESYSRPRLDLIQWQPTGEGNVQVNNETIDLYKYFDATRQAEFLYECVQQTIEKTLPDEIHYLEQYDHLKAAISELFDMPDSTMDLLIRFLHQNKGVLSKGAREKEFKALSDKECLDLEALYRDICKIDG
ncbi:MAG: Fic family protein [Alphaproteobacteria bacterium]|nr:Fic family protein [Alphaproteobacteria bacterium]